MPCARLQLLGQPPPPPATGTYGGVEVPLHTLKYCSKPLRKRTAPAHISLRAVGIRLGGKWMDTAAMLVEVPRWAHAPRACLDD